MAVAITGHSGGHSDGQTVLSTAFGLCNCYSGAAGVNCCLLPSQYSKEILSLDKIVFVLENFDLI